MISNDEEICFKADIFQMCIHLFVFIKVFKGCLFYMRCLSLSGLSWAKKTGIFIIGTLTIMTVGICAFRLVEEITFKPIASLPQIFQN